MRWSASGEGHDLASVWVARDGGMLAEASLGNVLLAITDRLNGGSPHDGSTAKATEDTLRLKGSPNAKLGGYQRFVLMLSTIMKGAHYVAIVEAYSLMLRAAPTGQWRTQPEAARAVALQACPQPLRAYSSEALRAVHGIYAGALVALSETVDPGSAVLGFLAFVATDWETRVAHGTLFESAAMASAVHGAVMDEKLKIMERRRGGGGASSSTPPAGGGGRGAGRGAGAGRGGGGGAPSYGAGGKPCFDFARGICFRGAGCKFAHVPGPAAPGALPAAPTLAGAMVPFGGAGRG